MVNYVLKAYLYTYPKIKAIKIKFVEFIGFINFDKLYLNLYTSRFKPLIYIYKLWLYIDSIVTKLGFTKVMPKVEIIDYSIKWLFKDILYNLPL